MIFPKIDIIKQIFNLLILREGLFSLRIELFEHVMELLEVEITCTWVIPLN